MGDTVALDLGQNLVKVKLNQFYGIEINDFAVSVAKTALWIAESQMLEETKDIVFANIDFLPLKSYTNIVEGNALTIDWETVVPRDRLSYIIGNPPFVGIRHSKENHRSQLKTVLEDIPKSGGLDYVTAWYVKATNLMLTNPNVKTAFVSTNSITQGEQVSILWKNLINKFDIEIDFAYKTFKWESEAKDKAAVHCVIIGFSKSNSNIEKFIFENGNVTKANNISPYLIDAPTVIIESRTKPLCNVSKITKGSQPTDGGHLILTEDEKNALLSSEPLASKYIRPYMGAKDILQGTQRFCLWLKDSSPSDLKKMPCILNRLEMVAESRRNSPKASTRKWAESPYLFTEDRQPEEDYLIIPVVSSEKRRYVPMAFVSSEVIANTNAQMVPNISMFEFGVLTSNIHMAWMRTVAGRMKSDYAYSAKIVYNNFPWPEVTDAQKEIISKTAQAILDARELYPDSSLADLYDELTMPVELRQAHQANDMAVMRAYGMQKVVDGKKTWLTESETVARLFEMYEDITKTK